MSYKDDLNELSIAAACYGGEVFDCVGRPAGKSPDAVRFMVDCMVTSIKDKASRAGFNYATARDMRWGAQHGAIYCVGWFQC